MSKDLHNDEEITIDLLEIANILKRNAGNIARVTGVFVVAAGVYLATATPVYESQALLRVKQPKGIGTSLLESMPMGNAMANTQLMNTYAEILKSRSVVAPVIKKTEQPNKDGKYPAYDAYVKGRITTAPFKDTEIMQLTVRANTPEKAQEANKLIVDGFLHRLTDLSRDQQKATRGFLEERAVAAKNELQTAEDKLTDYKKKNNIIAPDDAVKLASEKMSMVDKLSAKTRWRWLLPMRACQRLTASCRARLFPLRIIRRFRAIMRSWQSWRASASATWINILPTTRRCSR